MTRNEIVKAMAEAAWLRFTCDPRHNVIVLKREAAACEAAFIAGMSAALDALKAKGIKLVRKPEFQDEMVKASIWWERQSWVPGEKS